METKTKSCVILFLILFSNLAFSGSNWILSNEDGRYIVRPFLGQTRDVRIRLPSLNGTDIGMCLLDQNGTTLRSNETTSLSIGSLNLSSDLEVNGTLHVVGQITLDDLSNGNTSLVGITGGGVLERLDINVSNGSITVPHNTLPGLQGCDPTDTECYHLNQTQHDNIFYTYNDTFPNNLTIQGNLNTTGNIDTSGNLQTQGDLHVFGNVSLEQNIEVFQNGQIGGNFLVEGVTLISGNINDTVLGNLNVISDGTTLTYFETSNDTTKVMELRTEQANPSEQLRFYTEYKTNITTTSLFDPTNISNLIFWYDANQIDINDPSQVVNSSGTLYVQKWNDKSGNNLNATQGTSANRPIYTPNDVNGLPSLQFDGINDHLVVPQNKIELGNSTFFIVYQYDTLKQSFSFSGITGSTRFYNFYYGAGNTICFALGNNLFIGCTPSAIIGTSWHVYDIVSNGSTGYGYVDAIFRGSGTHAGVGILIANTAIATSLGAGQPMHGSVSEVLSYNRTITPTERSQVEEYLLSKYNLSGRPPLPPDLSGGNSTYSLYTTDDSDTTRKIYETKSDGSITLYNNITMQGDVIINGAITGLGLNKSHQNLTERLGGDHHLNQTQHDNIFYIYNDTFPNNLTIQGNLNTTGQTNLLNTLTGWMNALFKTNVSIEDKLDVTGNTNLQETNINQTLNVTGQTNLKNTNIDGTLNVTSNTKIEGNLNVTGNATIGNNTIYLDSTNNRIGIGTTPIGKLTIEATNQTAIYTSTAESEYRSWEKTTTQQENLTFYETYNWDPGVLEPDSVTGLRLWLDTEEINVSDSNQVRNASGTYYIKNWTDKSGNNLHANQTTEAEQPRYNQSGDNGKPNINLDGINDWLEIAGRPINDSVNNFTIFIVGKSQVSSDAAIYFETSIISGFGYWLRWYVTSTDDSISFAGGTGGISLLESEKSINDGKLHIINTIVDYANLNHAFYVDGNKTANTSIFSGNLSGQTSDVGVIGRMGEPSYGSPYDHYEGEIYEIMIYNKILSDQEKTGIEDYLLEKYKNSSRNKTAYLKTWGRNDTGQQLIKQTKLDGETTYHNNLTIQGNLNTAEKLYAPNVYNNLITASPIDAYISSIGEFGKISSRREDKENITNMTNATWLYGLNPVTFTYKQRKEDTTGPDNQLHYGLIAEEVEEINPQMVLHDNNGTPTSIKYGEIPTQLLIELQRLNERIEYLEELLNVSAS